MITVSISNARIVGEPKITNDQKGQKVQLNLHEYRYDTEYRADDEKHYPANTRYNRLIVVGYGDVAMKAAAMKLQAGAAVNAVCSMDFGRDCFTVRESNLSESDPNFGRVRWCQGLKLRLLDLEYARGSQPSPARETDQPKAAEESSERNYAAANSVEAEKPAPERERHVMPDRKINLDEDDSLIAPQRRRSYFG